MGRIWVEWWRSLASTIQLLLISNEAPPGNKHPMNFVFFKFLKSNTMENINTIGSVPQAVP